MGVGEGAGGGSVLGTVTAVAVVAVVVVVVTDDPPSWSVLLFLLPDWAELGRFLDFFLFLSSLP